MGACEWGEDLQRDRRALAEFIAPMQRPSQDSKQVFQLEDLVTDELCTEPDCHFSICRTIELIITFHSPRLSRADPGGD